MNHYNLRTYDSPNPLVRFAHRSRLKTALKLIPSVQGWILDFGCGDGYFCSRLVDKLGSDVSVVGFEPYMKPHSDCKIEILRDWKEVEQRTEEVGPANIVTCFETFEHFTPQAQEAALASIRGVIADDGLLIVSVPVEGGVPSLVKNLTRRIKYGGKTVYSWRNIWRSFLCLSIPETRYGQEYLSHMGFYRSDFEAVMRRYFKIRRRLCSPFCGLGPTLNSQVFYVACPR